MGRSHERPLPEKQALHEAPLRYPSEKITTHVIPAKAEIHFDFLPAGVATTLLSRGVLMRNPEDSPFVFVFDSDLPRPGVKTSERGGEKAKAKMDSGFRRNDGGGQFRETRTFSTTLPGRDFPSVRPSTSSGLLRVRGEWCPDESRDETRAARRGLRWPVGFPRRRRRGCPRASPRGLHLPCRP